MTLKNDNYNEFCRAFDALVLLAQDNEKIRTYVYQLHNKITNGATERIFKEDSLNLSYLKISEMNFQRYINQNETISLPNTHDLITA
jgi:hypothetical protein